MANWVRRILPSIDGCFQQARGSNGDAGGTISVQVTMHENARPSAKVRSVPGPLSGLVSCATMKLWNQRPPLFTGPEGQQHVVFIHFGS